MDYERTIHTTLYGKDVIDILKEAFTAVSCGYIADRCNKKCMTTAGYVHVNTMPNGEILVEAYRTDRLSSYVKNKNDVVARRWIAWLLKSIVKGSDLEWKRNSTCVVTRLSREHNVTVREVYCIYDALMSWSNFKRYYPNAIIEKIVGVENDPFKTEMEAKRRADIEELNTMYNQKISDASIDHYNSAIRMRYNLESTELYQRFKVESAKLVDELKAEHKQKLEELKTKYAAFDAIC